MLARLAGPRLLSPAAFGLGRLRKRRERSRPRDRLPRPLNAVAETAARRPPRPKAAEVEGPGLLASRAVRLFECVDEAPIGRGGGVDGATRQGQIRGSLSSDPAGKARRPPGSRDEPHGHLRKLKRGRLGRGDVLGEGRQLDTGPHTGTVHLCAQPATTRGQTARRVPGGTDGVGGDGIGKAAALSMAKEGANVVIVARRQEVLDQAVQDIKTATEGSVVPLSLDVTSDGASQKMIKTALDNFGRVDIVVNNAGTSMAKPFESVSHEDWESDFDLKVWSAVRLMQDAIIEMRKVGGGRIINVTNLGGRTPGPSSMPTSISRAAGIAITKGLSKDLAKDNILVTTVCIGLVKSGQHQRRYDARLEKEPNLAIETFYDELAKARSVPLGRVAEPEEAGDVIAFLASERASYLTGIAVNLDGGASAVL